jgi:hypothetical protein
MESAGCVLMRQLDLLYWLAHCYLPIYDLATSYLVSPVSSGRLARAAKGEGTSVQEEVLPTSRKVP